MHTFQRIWGFFLPDLDKMDKYKAEPARSTSFAQAGWTHVALQCKGDYPTVMQLNSFWMDGEGALSSWSMGTAVSVSPATRDGPWEQL